MRLASSAVSTLTRAGRAGSGQNMPLVLVLAEIVGDDLAFEAPRGDHGYLALEGDEALEDHRRGAERPVDRGDIGAFANERLALAVVAEPSRLEDRRTAEFADRAHQRARVLDPDERRGLEAEVAQERLFDEPVLGQRQRPRPGPNRHAFVEKLDGRGRHVLEFVGDDVDRLGEARERLLVFEGGDGAPAAAS